MSPNLSQRFVHGLIFVVPKFEARFRKQSSYLQWFSVSGFLEIQIMVKKQKLLFQQPEKWNQVLKRNIKNKLSILNIELGALEKFVTRFYP